MFDRLAGLQNLLRTLGIGVARRLRILERLALLRDEALQSLRVRRRASEGSIELFNLDLHISVVADVEAGLPKNVSLTKWSLSGHNRLIRKFRIFPDPVRHLNAKTWRDLDSKMIRKFNFRYRLFLSKFSGFVVTYPLSFAALFDVYKKPVLAVIAVRYETPFTSSPDKRAELNTILKEMRKRERLFVCANNRGDADYYEANVGDSIPVIHSVCDYVGEPVETRASHVAHVWLHGSSKQDLPLYNSREIPTLEEALGQDYSYRKLQDLRAVVFIPYTTSIMKLFEFAYIGIPVLIPSDAFLKELALQRTPGVLDQISFAGIFSDANGELPKFNDLSNPETLDWWLERADFNDPDLMPNVARFDSWEALSALLVNLPARVPISQLRERNNRLRLARQAFLNEFLCAVQIHEDPKRGAIMTSQPHLGSDECQ